MKAKNITRKLVTVFMLKNVTFAAACNLYANLIRQLLRFKSQLAIMSRIMSASLLKAHDCATNGLDREENTSFTNYEDI